MNHPSLPKKRPAGRGLALVGMVLAALVGLSGLAQGAPGHGQPIPNQPTAGQPTAGQPLQGQRIGLTPSQAGNAADAAKPDSAAAAEHGKAKFSEKALNKDEEGQGSYGAALVFWFFALMMVVGSIFVITRRNLITAVMGMIGTFFAIAAVYAMLYAHFLTAIQVLVYAGAIMVLFVFVIMILNKPETEPWSVTNLPGKIVIVAVLAYLMMRLLLVLWGIEVPDGATGTPENLALLSGESVKFGSTKAMGHTLFRDYLFPFEATSLVLLIAVVGAIAVARPHVRRPGVESPVVGGGMQS